MSFMSFTYNILNSGVSSHFQISINCLAVIRVLTFSKPGVVVTLLSLVTNLLKLNIVLEIRVLIVKFHFIAIIKIFFHLNLNSLLEI